MDASKELQEVLKVLADQFGTTVSHVWENRLLKEKLHEKEEELADMKIQVRSMLRRCGVGIPLNQPETGEIARETQG